MRIESSGICRPTSYRCLVELLKYWAENSITRQTCVKLDIGSAEILAEFDEHAWTNPAEGTAHVGIRDRKPTRPVIEVGRGSAQTDPRA